MKWAWRGLLLSCFLISSPAFAVKEFYSLTRSVRSLGMGGATYAVADDAYSLFSNPAGLGLKRRTTQIMLSTQTHLSTGAIGAVYDLSDTLNSSNSFQNQVTSLLEYQGRPFHANAGFLIHYLQGHFGVGILMADTKLNLAFLGRELDTNLDFTAISDSGVVVGYGDEFLDRNLLVGLNFKGIYRAGGRVSYSVLDFVQTSRRIRSDLSELGGAGLGYDFDLGLMYRLPNSMNRPQIVETRLGLSLNNILGSDFVNHRQGGAPPRLARTFSLGARMSLEGWSVIDNFHLAFDFAELGLGGEADGDLGARKESAWKHINFGVEAPIRGWLIPRMGFHQGLLTLGLGMNFKYTMIDFAWYGEELGYGVGRLSSRRLALRLAFGLGAAPEPPIARVAKVNDSSTDDEVEQLSEGLEKMGEIKVMPPQSSTPER